MTDQNVHPTKDSRPQPVLVLEPFCARHALLNWTAAGLHTFMYSILHADSQLFLLAEVKWSDCHITAVSQFFNQPQRKRLAKVFKEIRMSRTNRA